MGRYSGKTCRLSSMIFLTASFFLVEIVVGYVTNSLALVGDAYHMLSDIIALVIGIASVRIAKWHSRKNTYGWARAEVLGALVNAVFLIALCFTIFLEAIERLVEPDTIEEPDLLLIVGGIGLGVNIIGLVLFGHHSHSHGGHSHLTNMEQDAGASKKDDDSPSSDNGQFTNDDKSDDAQSNTDSPGHSDNDLSRVSDVNVEIEEVTRRKMRSSAQLNMRGVFLHVMGDALGSVIVIISALVVKYVEQDWKYRVDPAMSIVLVVIILSTSIPLLKESALILLQTVPTHIQVQDLQKKLINKVEGVIAVHEFHIWQLAGNRIIASAHIHCRNLRDYMRIAEEVKRFFHNEGIHSTTIQPEFVEEDVLGNMPCAIPCISECHPMQCCTGRRTKPPPMFDGKYKDGALCQDEGRPLMSLPYCATANGLCTDTSQRTSRLVDVDRADVGRGDTKPLLLDASSLEKPPQMAPPADERYKPVFRPLLRTLTRPQSMCDVPSVPQPTWSPRRTASSDGLVTPPTTTTAVDDDDDDDDDGEGDGTGEAALNGLLETETSPQHTEGATGSKLASGCTTSDVNLNRAIVKLKNDLKSLRGEAESKESILGE